jgi:hypothetical protein
MVYGQHCSENSWDISKITAKPFLKEGKKAKVKE